MLVDEDEFIIDQLDSSYGYAPKNYKKRGRSPREETEVEEVDSTLRKEDGGSINPQSISSSFLRTELNAESVPNFGEETMIRAGCSAEAVALARQLDVEPPKVSELTTKVNKEDAELLTTQLDKELYEEWRSSSLLGGLGVDHSGFVVGDSILRTYDLLCNINVQLLIMQRELLRHETKIRKLYGDREGSRDGFSDDRNKSQLCRLLRSLNSASTGLQDRITSLSSAVLEVPSETSGCGSVVSSSVLFAVAVGVLAVGFFSHRLRITRST